MIRLDVGKVLIDPADTVILLLDHHAGLFQTVKDISVAELRTNTFSPNYQAAMESFQKAQVALKPEKKRVRHGRQWRSKEG